MEHSSSYGMDRVDRLVAAETRAVAPSACQPGKRPAVDHRGYFYSGWRLAASGSIILLATTNEISQEIAVNPSCGSRRCRSTC